MSPIKSRLFMWSLLLVAISLVIGFLASCSDEDSVVEPEPMKPVFTEEVYDSIVTIGDEEAPTYWDEREQLGREQAIQNLSNRLTNRVDVSQVFPAGDVLVVYEHHSGILSAIATDTIPEPGIIAQVDDQTLFPGGEFGLEGEKSYRKVRPRHQATLFKYPALFGIPVPGTPPDRIKTELDNSDLFHPITLLDFSYDNLTALRTIPKESKIVYFFPHHGDGDVFQHGRCGTIGPFMQLDHIFAWEDLDAATQADVDACRIIVVRGSVFQEIWLTNRFLSSYFKGFTRKPLVMISACNLMNNPSALWNSLSGGGARALVGYSGSMTLADASNWEPYLVNKLMAFETLTSAMDAVHGEFASSQIMTFAGDGNWSLVPDWAVMDTNPQDGATNVRVGATVAALVTADLNPATVTTRTFTLSGMAGRVEYEDRMVMFIPSRMLDWNTQYTATITTGMKDLEGNSLEENYVWTFRTEPDPGSNCVQVKQGGWEFCLMNEGNCILQFVDGNLRQTQCYLSYDDDSVFAGPLVDNRWSGENSLEQFSFFGYFSGSPANSFSGTLTLTDGSGLSVDMIGQYGSLPGSSQETDLFPDSEGEGRGLGERLRSILD